MRIVRFARVGIHSFSKHSTFSVGVVHWKMENFNPLRRIWPGTYTARRENLRWKSPSEAFKICAKCEHFRYTRIECTSCISAYAYSICHVQNALGRVNTGIYPQVSLLSIRLLEIDWSEMDCSNVTSLEMWFPRLSILYEDALKANMCMHVIALDSSHSHWVHLHHYIFYFITFSLSICKYYILTRMTNISSV